MLRVTETDLEWPATQLEVLKGLKGIEKMVRSIAVEASAFLILAVNQPPKKQVRKATCQI